MGSLETHPGSPSDAPVPVHPGTTENQPSSRSQFNDLSNEIEKSLTPEELGEYALDQLIEKVSAAFTGSRFSIKRAEGGRCKIYNQQNEFLFIINTVNSPTDSYYYEIYTKYSNSNELKRPQFFQ